MENVNESEDFYKHLLDLIYRSSNQTMLQAISRKCGERLNVDSCLILSGVDSTETIQFGFWHRNQHNFNLTESFLLHPEVNTVLTTEQPQILSNALAESLFVTSLLGVRTQFQGTVNGFMMIGTMNAINWTSEQSNQLLEMSQYISIACAVNTPRENRSVNFNRNRGTSSSEIPIIRRLYDFNRQRLEQQQQLNEKKDQIITALSDKARNPLASMKVAIELLSNVQLTLSQESKAKYWESLRQEWNNLNELINSIVTLKQLDSKENTTTYQPQQIDLNTISEYLNLTFDNHQWIQEQRKSLNLEFDLSKAPNYIITDIRHLKNILSHLLTNAIYYSGSNQTILVRINPNVVNQKEVIQIAITNTGFGILENEKDLIYDRFYRGQEIINNKGIPGVGVGLAVVKELLEILGGRIEMTSHAINDSEYYLTTFTIELPVTPDPNLI